MLSTFPGRLTYANVMSTLAVFLALGGGTAAIALSGHNSVRSDDIAAGQVKTGDLKAPEAWHEVEPAPTAGGEPDFENSWVNANPGNSVAAFYRDPSGEVHVKGLVSSGTLGTQAFKLPSGYRPAETLNFPAVTYGAAPFAIANVLITPGGSVQISASIGTSASGITLDGIAFRACDAPKSLPCP